MKCMNCGAEIGKDDQFCGSCGTRVETENGGDYRKNTPDNDSGKSKRKGRMKKLGSIITTGLATIGVIMMVGALLGFFDKKPLPFIIYIGVIFAFGWIEDNFPKIPIIVIAFLEIMALIVCFNIASNVSVVSAVRAGCPSGYPDITYQEAFEDYFSNPTWKSIGKDENGNEEVKFIGNCTYFDQPAKAEIKFTVYEDQEKFVVSSVKIDERDMGDAGGIFVLSIFEKYDQNH